MLLIEKLVYQASFNWNHIQYAAIGKTQIVNYLSPISRNQTGLKDKMLPSPSLLPNLKYGYTYICVC